MGFQCATLLHLAVLGTCVPLLCSVWHISSVFTSIICKKPRIAPHREASIILICYFRSELYRKQCWRSRCHYWHPCKDGQSDSSAGYEMTINSGCSRFQSFPCALLINMPTAQAQQYIQILLRCDTLLMHLVSCTLLFVQMKH